MHEPVTSHPWPACPRSRAVPSSCWARRSCRPRPWREATSVPATRLRLSDGRSALMKTRARTPEDFFSVEAAGLTWLAEAGGVPIPDVLAAADDCLIVAWIEPGRPSADAAERLGRQLSTTQRRRRDLRRGRQRLHRDGAAAQCTVPHLAGLLRTAAGPPLPQARPRPWQHRHQRRRSDRRCGSSRIEEFAGPAEPPARIHGDLWSGNVVWSSDGVAWLVDPAAHGGHRETDLAMLTLVRRTPPRPG